MNRLIFLVLCWRFRKVPYQEFLEEYTLVLKAARRCAYDLGHAARHADDIELRELFSGRARIWQTIFSPTGAKDYRHELHHDIDRLEDQVNRLIQLCDDNKIIHNEDRPY